MKQFDAKDIEKNKAIAALSYIGILCLVPLLTRKNSEFCQENGRQGLVLFFVEVIFFCINIVPLLGQLIWFLAAAVCLILSIIAIVNTLQGKYWEIPFLGEYAKRIKF